MALPINVRKDRIESFLKSIREGTSIEAPPEGWSGHDMLMLAGVCRFGAFSQGPKVWYLKGVEDLHPERREAVEDTFQADLDAGIGWNCQVAEWMADGKYDEHFEDTHSAFVGMADGKHVFKPLRGFRNVPK